jgi:hypothetical protein
LDAGVDYYDILRVVPEAEPSIIAEAYSTLRNYYVRLVNGGYAKADLLDFLEEAYEVTSNAESRRQYDEKRNRGGAPAVASAGENGHKPVAGQSAVAIAPSTATAHERPSVAAPAERMVLQERSAAHSVVVPAGQTEQQKTTRPAAAAEGPRGGLLSSIGGAGGVIGALGRQLGSLSRREQQQVEEKLAQRVQDQVDTVEAEEALLIRLSATAANNSDTAQGLGAPRARLTLIEGPGSGATFEIARFPLTLGGDGDCDITLPGLASRQARLLYRDGRFVVYNLAGPDSSAESAPWWILESGDDLTVGPYKLRFTATHD